MVTFIIENWFVEYETFFLTLQSLAIAYNLFFFLFWLYHLLKCAIEWNLGTLRRFKLFNCILSLLKKEGMLTYIE
jgi:hypothetical protein